MSRKGKYLPFYVGTLYMCCVAQDQASWFLRQGLGVGLSRRDLSTRWECQNLACWRSVRALQEMYEKASF